MEPEKHDFQAKIITFGEVYNLAHKLSLEITKHSLSFDIIIGIARGGVIPARFLCDFLNIEKLTSLQIRHYTSGARQLENAEIIDPVDVEINGKNVLLVDDVNDSGKTIREAVEHIQSLNPSNLKTAVIHEKETTSFRVDYVGENQQEWEWLIYEWAATEDIIEFLNRDEMLDADQEDALKHLKEKYGLDLETDFFQNVMEMRNHYS